MKNKPFISVIIKTFNEQDGIAKTIRSIKDHIGGFSHEIIVADSLSIDNTQKIAIENDVLVVSLIDPNDRCCGVGHQLGYQIAKGDYILLLDGDMELEESFIEKAIHFLEKNSIYAGVAGKVEMDDASSYEFKSRKQRINKIYPLGDCDHLGGGGLYRKSAIDKIGYLTNKNLHAYEEAELGMRLINSGYKLRRLDTPYFKHTSYDMPSMEMLKYRWRNRYLFASGELVRNSWGQKHFKDAIKIIKNEVIFSVYIICVLFSLFFMSLKLTSIALLPIVIFWLIKTIKNKSVIDGSQSIINLMAFSIGLFRGLLIKPKNPNEPPEFKIISRHKIR